MVNKLRIEDVTPKVSVVRSVASQMIACMAPNLLLLDLGMAISFSTIALPDLMTSKESISLNDVQASWFGSIAYLTQPLGAVVSGPMVDYFGRKKANFIVNIPHLVAWTLMYFSWNLTSLFVASGLLGLGNGVMEAPVNAYVGEVSEASVRGALCTMTQFFTSVGVFVMYFLGTVVYWRHAALICLLAPVCSMLFVLLVPESPVWLLSRNREKEALKSLCFLRGWTSPENVRSEFDELVVYSRTLQRCAICKPENTSCPCPHEQMNWFTRKLLKFRHVMLCKETLRPWTLVMVYFTCFVMSGYSPIRPYMVNVSDAFGMNDDGKNIVLNVGVITLVTSLIVIILVKLLGKRKLAISSMLGAALSCTALSWYGKGNLPETVFSYNTETFPEEKNNTSLIIFYSLIFFTGCGIPWVLLGEVFPFRSRASAQGLAAAGNYVIMFIASKTFIDLESEARLWGAFAVYAAFGFAGTIYLYFFLPETEGKSLIEIESYYSGEFRTFADDPVINTFKKFKKKKIVTINA